MCRRIRPPDPTKNRGRGGAVCRAGCISLPLCAGPRRAADVTTRRCSATTLLRNQQVSGSIPLVGSRFLLSAQALGRRPPAHRRRAPGRLTAAGQQRGRAGSGRMGPSARSARSFKSRAGGTSTVGRGRPRGNDKLRLDHPTRSVTSGRSGSGCRLHDETPAAPPDRSRSWSPGSTQPGSSPARTPCSPRDRRRPLHR